MEDENKDSEDERKKKMYQIFRLNSPLSERTGSGDEEKLGEPDKVQYTKDGRYHYKKSIWNTSMGQLIKMETMSHFTPEDFAEVNKPQKTRKEILLEEIIEARELLEMAAEDEDYEYCAELRDRLTDLKVELLEEKNNPTKLLEDKEVDDNDSWNF